MSAKRRGRTPESAEATDEVYELEVEDESPEDALREAAEAADATAAAERTGGAAAPAAGGDDALEAMREKYLRALADFDNYRKRVERERGETARSALREPLLQFLEVADNLDRALRAGGGLEDLRSGVEMILRQTHDLLRRLGVEEVAAVGEPFDPAVHEAVLRYEDPEATEQRVSEEFQRGYLYQGRLLRPAMVKVAVPPESGGSGGRDE